MVCYIHEYQQPIRFTFGFVISGGGNMEEGELIEVVEMTIPQITDYVNQEYMQSPGDFAFAITWFLNNRQPKT
jgi:hypothetical protein